MNIRILSLIRKKRQMKNKQLFDVFNRSIHIQTTGEKCLSLFHASLTSQIPSALCSSALSNCFARLLIMLRVSLSAPRASSTQQDNQLETHLYIQLLILIHPKIQKCFQKIFP